MWYTGVRCCKGLWRRRWVRLRCCLPAQVHGFPKVMGVLTHLDGFKDAKRLKKTKKVLKHRFWAEIYQGAPCPLVLHERRLRTCSICPF